MNRKAIYFLLVRVTLGIVFVLSGWGKIHNTEKVISYFMELKIPYPVFSAHLTSWTELIAGTLILLGLLTRISAFAIFVIMTVAILTTQIPNLEHWTDLPGTVEYLYALLSLGLILIGAERYSLDTILKSKVKNK